MPLILEEKTMTDVKKIFTAIGLIAAAALLVSLYGIITIQETAGKLNERNILLSTGQNAVPTPPAPLPAEIRITLINSAQKESLVSLLPLVGQLRQIPEIKITAEKSLDMNSDEARELIEKYRIEKIPALLLEGETGKAAVLSQNWPALGSSEADGTLVLRNIPPPYRETATGRVRGMLKAVFVSVPDQNGVFDARAVFTEILQNAFGINPAEEETIRYDSTEGRALVEKYRLEKLPAFMLSGDLNVYAGFPENWLQIGSLEDGNIFVFRRPDAISGIGYWDLNKNEVVETARAGS
ncbi:MAG: hypothetical protein HY917_03355 [Candidatus Diapherotrites archaeon]|nr:hypothetical protein [Candidatus Diapherotrites archaeon]